MYQAAKPNIDKWAYIKLKNIYLQQRNSQQSEKAFPIEWEKYFQTMYLMNG